MVKQPDGSLKSSPFHVRFGKLKLMHSKEKAVTLAVNDKVSNVAMVLGDAGEAFFVRQAVVDQPVDSNE